MNKKLEVTNPFNGELLETLDYADATEIQKMVDAAEKAQKEWAKLSIVERGKILYKFCDLVEQNTDLLGDIMAKEQGKPILGARGEGAFAAELGRGYIERAKHLYGEVMTDTMEGAEADVVFTRRVPLGIVASIVPFNFPVELSMAKSVAPLIMGNAVLMKAPSSNPLNVKKVVELAYEAGVPNDLLPFIVCERSASNEAIVQNPKVASLSLTGSTEAGIDLARNGATTLKRVFLELGGNDPLIITEDADLDNAVEETIGGRLENCGQVCCSTKRVLVANSIKKEFIGKLVAALNELKIGDPMDLDVEVSCLVSEAAAQKAEEQINITVKEGGKLVLGGTRDGALIPPTVIDEVSKDSSVAKDMEIFAPVYPIIGFDTVAEAIEIANSTIYGLSAGVITGDTITGMQIADRIDASGVVVNGSGAYRHTEQAWGGCKMTGVGYEGVSTSLEEYSRIKTFTIKGAFSDI